MTMAEQRMNDQEQHDSMVRRLDTMIMAVGRFERGGKSKNAGITNALLWGLCETKDRFEHAWSMLQYYNNDASEPTSTIRSMLVGEHIAFFPVIRKWYDTLADYRIMEPSEVTETTFRDAMREQRQLAERAERLKM